MTEYLCVNVKLSKFELSKLKPAAKNATGITLRLSSDMIGTDQNIFLRNFLLTDRPVASLSKVFANNSSPDMKLSETKLPKIIHLSGFLNRLLVPLQIFGLPLMKNVLKPLTKGVLIPLALTATASAMDAAIKKTS